MLKVTESAKRELKERLSSKSDNPQAGLRLSISEGDTFDLSIGEESPGDQAVEHEGAKVLLVSPELATRLEGATMDLQETAEGTRLVIHFS